MLPLIIKNFKNSESPESTLNKLYKAKPNVNITRDLKTLDPNPCFFNRNSKISLENKKSRYWQRNLRRHQLGNFKTENSDYNQCSTNNLLNLTEENPRNNQIKNKRSIDHFNEKKFINLSDAVEKIKFLDFLKSEPLYINNNNFDKETIFEANLFTSACFNNNYDKIDKTNNNTNSTNPLNTIGCEKIIPKNKFKCKPTYMSNLNQYSIKDSFLNNGIKSKNIKKNFTKDYLLRGNSHVYSKDIINKNLPSPYYDEYKKNLDAKGFRKEKSCFDDYFKIALNECLFRNFDSKKNKINRLNKRVLSNPSNLKFGNSGNNSQRPNCGCRRRIPIKKILYLH